MFDLGQFLESNKSLQDLAIGSLGYLTRDQVDVLRGAIAATGLSYLRIQKCNFADDGSLDQVLSACTKVENMRVTCEFISHCSALSALLRDPTNVLKMVVLEHARTDENVDAPESNEIIRELTSGLANITKLTTFHLNWQRGEMALLANGYFHKLLCNPTSIESIYSSNHTLEDIKVDSRHSRFLDELLRHNWSSDKSWVARNKILKYYFVGDFDVAPFTNLPVSVIPEIISQIRSETKQFAIFRLLKCIPELSNVGNRNLSSNQVREMKRQKIGV